MLVVENGGKLLLKKPYSANSRAQNMPLRFLIGD